MLSITNLHAKIGDNEILRGLSLELKAGEVQALMGPNGSGKSTLANVLAGHEAYEVTGQVLFEGEDLLAMSPEDRAAAGVFLAFQHPVEIPGVGNLYFMRTALNSLRRHRGLDEIDAMDFLEFAKEKMELVEMDRSFMSRSVNEGFSGGEKKRNEILQMAILEPRLAILDETDSGLDIDALRVVANGVNALRSQDRAMLVITHHQRLLDYIVPDRVHVMAEGRIVRSGDKQLARALEEHGYVGFDQVSLEPSASVAASVTTGRDGTAGVTVALTGGLALLEREPGDDDPVWLTEVRRSASEWVGEHGFPTHKDEDWRYTRLEPILAVAFERGVARARSPARTEGDQRTRRRTRRRPSGLRQWPLCARALPRREAAHRCDRDQPRIGARRGG